MIGIYYSLGYTTLGKRCLAFVEEGNSIFEQFLEKMTELYLEDSIDTAEEFRKKSSLLSITIMSFDLAGSYLSRILQLIVFVCLLL